MADGASGKVPVGECIAVAYRFLATHWGTFAPAAAVTAVFGGVSAVLLATAGGPTALAVAVSQLIAMLPVALAGIAFNAAVLRKAVRDETGGLFGLRFGADELRLVGVLAALALFFTPLVMVVAFVISAVVLSRLDLTDAEIETTLSDPDKLYQALTDALGPSGVIALYLFVLLCVLAFVVLRARLLMIDAATIGERKMVFLQTWGWSRGNVGRVTLAMIAVALPAVIVNDFLASAVAGPPGRAIAWPLLFVQGAALQFVSALTGLPLLALGAHLYRGLRPPDFVAR